jgi:putative DNA methylase
LSNISDLWITDPPYADAVNYHELLDFYLAWFASINDVFPEWASSSRKALAVQGTGDDFKRSMIEIYTNLANNMPDKVISRK